MGRVCAKTVFAVMMFLFFSLAFERRAYAYTDPGSGLLAVQYLLSLAAGALFYFRRYLAKLFGSRSRENPPDKE
jgi:hypothetical protein